MNTHSISAIELEELVEAGLAENMSARAMAAALGIERGRVDRCVARLKKRQRTAEAEAVEAEEPSSLQQQIDSIDVQIAAATAAGNDLRALRLSKLRSTLVAQIPPEAPSVDGADWSLLSEAGRSVFEHCIRVSHGEPGTLYWEELLARVRVFDDRIHPAHVELPAGAPEGVRLLVPGGS